MDKTIASCYLTHNHPDVIDLVLENMCELYTSKGIDIYIYDSSPDDLTENVVKKYQEQGFDRLFYVDVRFIDGCDEKMLYILQGKGLNKHYDYIWPTKDRCFFVGDALDKIVESVNDDYDLVFALDEKDRWELRNPKYKDVYDDPVEFFSHYGQLTTNWEAVIRKTSTLLDDVDWEEYSEKYKLGKNSFNQTITLFAKLSELDECRIRVIHHETNEKANCVLASSSWWDRLLKIWVDEWIAAIFMLPAIYDAHKLAIVKSELGLPALFGSTNTIVYLRNSGQLTPERYEQLKSMWSMITDYPLEYLEMIVRGEEQELFSMILDRFHNDLRDGNYEDAYYIFMANPWIKQTMSDEDYKDLEFCFVVYKNEINKKGYSVLFNDVDSLSELLEKYRSLKRN